MVRLLMLSGLILLLAAPTAAGQGVRERILRECQEGRITGNYSPGQLRDARKHIPTDIDEYSDCRDVLSRAALAGNESGDGGGGGGAGGGSGRGGIDNAAEAPGSNRPANDRETQALGDARTSADELIVDGDRILPGVAAQQVRRDLPTPLIVVLALLGLCALAAFLPTARRRVHLRRATQ